MITSAMLSCEPYEPPAWASHLSGQPTKRFSLGRLPTPIHRWDVPLLEELGVRWFIKRDDLSGFELGGNKVRKLEFLMAEAADAGADCVVTIGGIQSNHCRATAAAARYLGMDSVLILRCPDPDKDPGLVGNLLLERMMGATIKTVSVQEYQRVGSAALTEQVAEELRSQGRNPYVIPVGGSNTCGTWGYIEGISELEKQLKMGGVGIPSSGTFDHIVFACGSGGTASGIGLGCALSGVGAQTAVHAVGVCDSPEWFYNFIRQDIHPGLGCEAIDPESYLRVIQGRGHGYAVSTDEELRLCKDVAASTAVLLDPVYSGKALYAFVQEARADPERFRGKDILFWHTGGGLGMFEKAEQLAPLLSGQATRLQVPPLHTQSKL